MYFWDISSGLRPGRLTKEKKAGRPYAKAKPKTYTLPAAEYYYHAATAY